MKYDIITVLWGAKYTQFYIDFVLPSQLSEGNLDSFCCYKTRYMIYTTKADADLIQESVSYKKLSDTVPTGFVFIDSLSSVEKYNRMTLCHKNAIQIAEQNAAVLVFLPPDVIFATGSFQNLLAIAERGARAVMVAVPRVDKKTVTPLCISAKLETGVLAIKPRSMVEIMLSHLHPVARSLFYDSKEASQWPSQIYFNVQESGLIAHCFHLHPILVNPKVNSVSFDITIDGDYLLSACPDSKDIIVVTDSDVIMAMEPCDDSYGATPTSNRYDLLKITEWAKNNANNHHRYFFLHRICFHCGETESPEWIKMKNTSEIFKNYILSWISR